ncbi:excisionase family DNA binding protein [Agromyces sp. 3263]|uniref:helix-turn-helix domain-containing protein n=1 Tax=Agromyces sp. 3263 TaxID=2817750 RepID=UPI00285B72E8|nr:helix-turn-helix domain-containing protein [Agromyces sp. 3263]MDR6907514.1 excisionase family DNA binding protein [Agromyces sp. 3263]
MRRAYTVPALADELGKSESYIEGLIRENRIAARKVGRTTLVLADDYETFLEQLPEA